MTDEQALKDAVVEALSTYEATGAVDDLHEALKRVRALRSFRTPKAEPEVALAPCPFCESPNVEIHPQFVPEEHISARYAHCHGCGAEGPCGVGENPVLSAIALWNTRTPVAKPTPEAEVTKVEASEPTDEEIDAFLLKDGWTGWGTILRELIKKSRRQFSLPKASTPRLTDAEIMELGKSWGIVGAVGMYSRNFIEFARSIESKARGES